METYKIEMEKILNEFAEAVPDSNLKDEDSWYLNHFPVLRSDKTTLCRIVWNSAAVYDGLALNDSLTLSIPLGHICPMGQMCPN